MSSSSKVSPMSIARRSPVTGTDVSHLAKIYLCNANDNYYFNVCVFEDATLWELRCVGLCIGTSVASKTTGPHAWKAEYIIVDYAGKCNVNFHYDLIEPDKNTDLGPLQKYCFWPTKKYSLSP